MSKYIKLYDAIMAMDEWFSEPITPTKILSDLPTIEVSEDCISREYLKSFEYINKGDFNSVETIREWIDNAPSVTAEQSSMVDIVHCRDCKHNPKYTKDFQYGRCVCTCDDDWYSYEPSDDFFCGYGERIEE